MKDSPGEAANQNNRAGSGICTGNGSVNSLRGILPFDPPGVGHADRIAFFQLLRKRLSRHSFKFQCPAVGGGQLDQLSQLVDGIAQLSGEYGRFHEGLAQYASGLSALAENYGQLESGANQLAGGAGQLAGGAGELRSGMNQLNASTITLPETMKRQIADMTAEFDFPKFDPVSFVSPQNANVEAVQFVMTTAAIEQPEAPEPEEPEQEQTIWDRFLALFQG